MCNYYSYQFTVWALLLQHPIQCHSRFLQGRHTFPLYLQAAIYISVSDTKFQAVKSFNPPPLPLTHPPCPLWISLATTNLIDKCAALQRNPRRCRNVARSLTKYVHSSVIDKYRRRTEKVAAEIGACMEPAKGYSNVCEAYIVLH